MTSAGRIRRGISTSVAGYGARDRVKGFVRGTAAGWALCGLLVAACGSKSAVLEETVPTTTDNTQPPAEDESVYQWIEAAVRDAAVVIDGLRTRPQAVEDPDDPEIQELAELHASGSPRLDRILSELEDLAAEGYRHVLLESHPVTEVVLFGHDIINPDTVEFQYCEARDEEVLDSDDELVETHSGVAFGDGEARRVDGKWVIYEMEEWHQFSISPGRVQSRECLFYLDNPPPRPETEEERDDPDSDSDENESSDSEDGND